MSRRWKIALSVAKALPTIRVRDRVRVEAVKTWPGKMPADSTGDR